MGPMLGWLRSRTDARSRAKQLYGAVVAAGLRPEVFLAGSVADTPEGRFEVLLLHLFLVLERLKAEGPTAEEPARLLIEAFVEDMDDSLREMGVGDLTVPRKVKKAAAALFERSAAYRRAIADPARLAEALAENIPAGSAVPIDAGRLAGYAERARHTLRETTATELLAGRLPFEGVAL